MLDLTFTQLITEGTRVQKTLTDLAAEVAPIRTQSESNITALVALISRFDNASTTASATNSAGNIRQLVTLDYITLANTGSLTTASTVAAKRAEWKAILR